MCVFLDGCSVNAGPFFGYPYNKSPAIWCLCLLSPLIFRNSQTSYGQKSLSGDCKGIIYAYLKDPVTNTKRTAGFYIGNNQRGLGQVFIALRLHLSSFDYPKAQNSPKALYNIVFGPKSLKM